jgi:hypothetical protein
MMENISGRIVGYDPGGEEDHGFAELRVENGEAQSLKSLTLDNAEAVIKATLDTEKHQDLIGVGIDTMTCWSTGKSGWRPADNWLRNQYDEVEKSVVSPNSMQRRWSPTTLRAEFTYPNNDE